MYVTVQVLGSVLILAAFIAALTNRITQTSYTYLGLNVVGSTTLAVEAAMSLEWGFLLLEGAWSAMSLVSLAVKALRTRTTATR